MKPFLDRLSDAVGIAFRDSRNPYAGGIALQQADRVALDVSLGAGEREAIIAGFCGVHRRRIIRAMGMPPLTLEESQSGNGIYRPISKNHSDR